MIDEQPQLIDAWEQLGHARMAMGQPQAALEAFERAMELSGGSPPVAGAMASALLGLGRLDEAAQYAELAVDGHEQSRDVLAQIRIRQGDLDSAAPIVDRGSSPPWLPAGATPHCRRAALQPEPLQGGAGLHR